MLRVLLVNASRVSILRHQYQHEEDILQQHHHFLLLLLLRLVSPDLSS